MDLIWNTCNNGSWCSFLSINLDHLHFNNLEGVYIIWQGKGPVVRIGQGIIRDKLFGHRNDRAVISYSNLFVTWATVPSKPIRDGVERYLVNQLKPLVRDVSPDVSPDVSLDVVPIEVNLPW